MGALRFFFALSVLYSHAYPVFGYRMLDGYLAVIAFFVISGFYMTLILNQKYVGKNNSYRLFISNRFLRIYPVYWIGMLMLLLATFAKHSLYPGSDLMIEEFIQHYNTASVWQLVFGVGDDILRNVTLLISTDYFFINRDDPFSLLVKQAWTLQVELLFYLVAPFIVRRSVHNILGLLGSLIFFQLIVALFQRNDLLTSSLTGMFIFYMCFFLLGALSYHLYAKLTTRHIPKRFLYSLFFIFLFVTVFYSHIATFSGYILSLPINTVMYIAIFTPVLPFIFYLSKKGAVDRWLGELSYPMYIIHSIIIKVLQSNSYFSHHPQLFTIVLIILTIATSWLLVKVVDIPIDKIRQKRLQSTKQKGLFTRAS